MSAERKLSLEIYRDVTVRDMSTVQAEHGIDKLRSIDAGIQIVRTTRLIRLPGNENDSFWPGSLSTRTFRSDLNVVLTRRTLTQRDGVVSETGGLLGAAIHYKGDHGPRFAVIQARSDYVMHTAAHETAHLLEVTETHDGHCVRPSCIMHQRPGWQLEISREYETLSWPRRGVRVVKGTSSVRELPATFCDDCTRQIKHNVRRMRRERLGRPATL